MLSLYNLEDWIFSKFNTMDNMNILDIGCGWGKQIFALAKRDNFRGKIFGIDMSYSAVNAVNNWAKDKGLSNVKAIRGNFDNFEKILENTKFDVILSTYAIYYSKNMKKLIIGLRKNLNQDGHMFICGPAIGTNKEMNQIITSQSEYPLKLKVINDFISAKEITEISAYYSGFKTERLHNKILFQSHVQVLEWWKNHNSFIPRLYESIEKALSDFFTRNDVFDLTKNVLGVHFMNQ